MGIERHDQLSGPHRPPHAEIDFIAAHHPAQEQIEPLAGAAGRGPRKEIADAGALRDAAVDRGARRAPGRACEKLSSAPPTSTSESASPSAKNCSTDPDCSSICRRIHSSAASRRRASTGAPSPAARGAALTDRTRGRNCAGRPPMMRNSVEIDASTLATRPKASAAAQKPAISPILGPRERAHQLHRVGGRVLAVVVVVQALERRRQRALRHGRMLRTS